MNQSFRNSIFFIGLTVSLIGFLNAKTNFVIFLADDLGYGDVGYQGGDVSTPNIDSIANEGIRFTDGYVSCPVCAPSRAGLLTGRYQNTFGFWDNIGPYRVSEKVKPGIPLDVPILSEVLKSLGYMCGLFGKSHDGSDEAMMPFNRWDEFYGFNNGASNYLPDLNRNHNPIFHNKKIISMSYSSREVRHNTVIQRGVLLQDGNKYFTNQLGDQAVSFIEQNQDQPFLCYIPFNAVHGPFQATRELFDHFDTEPNHQRRIVKAMIKSLDQNIGKVLNALKEYDLEENTMVIFLSDNGGHESSVNLPLRGKKGTFWEGGIRVPFCLKWPARFKSKRVYWKPVISLDIFPTLVVAAGGEVNPDWKLDGVNLLPFLKWPNKDFPHETLYWSWGSRKAIRDKYFKIISHDGGKTYNAFELSKDRSESNDLAEQRPYRVKELIQKHKEWESDLMPQQWGWNSKLGFKDPNFGKPKPYHERGYFKNDSNLSLE
jgi:arylsulfatase A-like enzyme